MLCHLRTLAGIVLSGCCIVSGCSSSDPDEAAVSRRAETVDTINDMRQDLVAADAQVVSTQQSLARLTSRQSGDPAKRYAQFRDEVAKNEEMSNRINARASKLTNDSYRQINEWDYQSRTIRNEELRQKSRVHEAAARTQHEEMVSSLNELRSDYTTYIRALQDIETYVANNLTPQGLAELGEDRAKAAGIGQQLRQQMSALDGRLSKIAAGSPPSNALAAQMVDRSARPAGQQMAASSEVHANSPATVGH